MYSTMGLVNARHPYSTISLEVLLLAIKNKSIQLPLPAELTNMIMEKWPSKYLEALMKAGMLATATEFACSLLKAETPPVSGLPWPQIDQLQAILMYNIEDQEAHNKKRFFARQLLAEVNDAVAPFFS